MAPFSVRPAGQADGAFLGDMVVEAANWRPGAARPKHQVLTAPEHSRYVVGVEAPERRGLRGAGRARASPSAPRGTGCFRAAIPGFGYVGTGVPELIIGVRPIWRAHGVGRTLLQALTQQAPRRRATPG